MKRSEIVKLTGYSGRHISELSPPIPGASRTPGGQWRYDSKNQKLQAWIKSARSQNDAKAARRAAGVRKPSKRPSSRRMHEDLEAMEEFILAFNACRPVLQKITLSPLGLGFPNEVPFAEWFLLCAFWKSLGQIPSEENLLVIVEYTNCLPAPTSVATYFDACSDFVAQLGFSDHPESLARLVRISRERQHAFSMYFLGLADLFIYGKRHFGVVRLSETLKNLTFLVEDVHKATAIGLIPPDLRHEQLTPEHYWVLGQFDFGDITRFKRSSPSPLKDKFDRDLIGANKPHTTSHLPPDMRRGERTAEHAQVAESSRCYDVRQKAHWLKRARAHKLSPRELERSISIGKVTRDNRSTWKGARMASPTTTIEEIVSLFYQWQNDNGNKVFAGPESVRRRFLNLVLPIVEMFEKVSEGFPESVD